MVQTEANRRLALCAWLQTGAIRGQVRVIKLSLIRLSVTHCARRDMLLRGPSVEHFTTFDTGGCFVGDHHRSVSMDASD